eukprot:6347656-Pyramimonas_sp.AAC.1
MIGGKAGRVAPRRGVVGKKYLEAETRTVKRPRGRGGGQEQGICDGALSECPSMKGLPSWVRG